MLPLAIHSHHTRPRQILMNQLLHAPHSRPQRHARLGWLALCLLLCAVACQGAATTPTVTPAAATVPATSVAITAPTETPPCPPPGSSHLLAFSADGAVLAYGYQESTRSRLYLLDMAAARAGTVGALRLVADDGWAFSWDVAEDRLVYAGTSGRTLNLLNANGEAAGEIDIGWQHAFPAWSPTGDQVALIHTDRRRDEAGLAASGLMLLTPDGDSDPLMRFSLRQLAALRGDAAGTARDIFNSGPAWSPDGRDLAVVAADGLYWLAAAGGDPVRLTGEDICAQQPAWSPSGQRIAFLSAPLNAGIDAGWGLQTTQPDGSGQVTLVSNQTLHLRQFAWSPDGAHIAFIAAAAPAEAALYLIKVDGDSLTALSTPVTGAAVAAAWLPDGSAIAVLVGNTLGLIDLGSAGWSRLGTLPQP